MRLLILLLLYSIVYADLPVHCVHHQIQGKWKLFISEPVLKGPGAVPCGHEIPDRSDNSFSAGQNKFKSTSSLELNLNDDSSVSDLQNESGGHWTMVYDEGFEIKYRNVKYFAFSKYEPDGRGAKSFCGETLIGWYNNLDTGERGCYKGQKVDEKVQETSSLEQVSIVQPEFSQQTSKNEDLDLPMIDDFLAMAQVGEQKIKTSEEIVEHLNSIEGKKWEAKVYPEFQEKSIKELNQMAGRHKYYQKSAPKTTRQSFIQMKQWGSNEDLPREFSWEKQKLIDKKLYSYLASATQQKSCGSCYAIATMAMLSARLRIQGEDVTLSPQYSLDCNYYNQGCDGGYPFLVEKFAQEQYLATESQYPYQAVNGNCHHPEFGDKLYSVSNYRYVGGAYGLSNEKEIMAEIYHNGPVVLSFEPTQDFMYYSKGVYHSVNHNLHQEWEKVDHSVLCYGWGEENGEQYWLLQNSWGPQWGENGNFRMRRGIDESAIESMAEAADPIIIRNAYSFAQLNQLTKNKQNLRKQE